MNCTLLGVAMGDQRLERLRGICLGLPEAAEKEAWGTPTFRVRDRIFAQYEDDHHGRGRVELWVKAPAGVQEMLVGADPARFFRPAYVGHKGWVGVYLDVEVDWEEVAGLVEESYRMTAPKRLATLLDGGGEQGAGGATEGLSGRRPVEL